MNSDVSQEGGVLTLFLRDQLTVEDRQQFQQLINHALGATSSRVKVDLSGLTYMDSAGLGFLVTLRNEASGKQIEVELAKASGMVKDLLELARFDTLFKIT